MAMYRYFDSMAEIHGELVERVVELNVAPEQRAEDWAEQLVTTFSGIRSVLLASPDILPLLGNTAHVGPRALAVVEQVLQIMQSAGFSAETSAVGFHTLLSYTLGSCGLQNTADSQLGGQAGDTRTDMTERLEARLDGAASEGLAAVAQHKTALADFMSEERFNAGLRMIVRGLEDSP